MIRDWLTKTSESGCSRFSAFTHTHSPLLAILAVIDLIAAFLIWHEYQWRRRRNVWDL